MNDLFVRQNTFRMTRRQALDAIRPFVAPPGTKLDSVKFLKEIRCWGGTPETASLIQWVDKNSYVQVVVKGTTDNTAVLLGLVGGWRVKSGSTPIDRYERLEAAFRPLGEEWQRRKDEETRAYQ